MTGGSTAVNLRERNRWIVRMLLAVIATLVVAAFLVGIRW
jgi:hypothetical protein